MPLTQVNSLGYAPDNFDADFDNVLNADVEGPDLTGLSSDEDDVAYYFFEEDDTPEAQAPVKSLIARFEQFAKKEAPQPKAPPVPVQPNQKLQPAPQPLNGRYQPESQDAGHRMGDFLYELLNPYARSGTSTGFFDWVSDLLKNNPAQLQGYVSALKDPKSMLAFAKGVKYLADGTQRAKYEVLVSWQLTRRGELLDTAKVKNAAAAQGKYKISKTEPDWIIWAMSTDKNPRFYSHVPKYGRFHHSSFFAGGSVGAAGEWLVKDGALLAVNGKSGHYRPDLDHFIKALYVLRFRCALRPETDAVVWKKGTADRVAIKALKLLDEANANNLYQPFPQEVAQGVA
jgi:hypothetical protein